MYHECRSFDRTELAQAGTNMDAIRPTKYTG